MIVKFLGDPNAFGQPVKKVVTYCSNGSVITYLPVSPATSFSVNDQITLTCNNDNCRCHTAMTVDTRFQVM